MQWGREEGGEHKTFTGLALVGGPSFPSFLRLPTRTLCTLLESLPSPAPWSLFGGRRGIPNEKVGLPLSTSQHALLGPSLLLPIFAWLTARYKGLWGHRIVHTVTHHRLSAGFSFAAKCSCPD